MPIIIRASVGRGGVNRFEDVRVVQELLNKHTPPRMQPLTVDGIVGPKTIAAIEDFQRRVLSMIHPDGRVDPDGPTLRALCRNATVPPSTPSFRFPSGPGRPGLTEADFQRAARTLQCEIPGIKAVAEVESRGDGFWHPGDLKFYLRPMCSHVRHSINTIKPTLIFQARAGIGHCTKVGKKSMSGSTKPWL